jgi:hypothetical protein
MGFDWHFFNRRLSIGIGLADYDHALTAHFCIGLINLYWHLDHWPLYQRIRDRIKRKNETYGNGRTIGFSFGEGMLLVDIWNDPMEHRHADPRWWHFAFIPRDFFFGHSVHSERTIRESRVDVPMPERNYPATVRVFESTWKRPRWPWPKRIVRCDITPDTPIPFPGKGENSWDCGEDATHSMTCMASTEYEAVAKLVESVLRDRHRHGGKQWRPAKVPA